MELTDWLAVGMLFISIALIAVILMQVMGEGLGGLQSGSFVRTRRGVEKTMFQLTIVLIVIWIVVAAISVVASR